MQAICYRLINEALQRMQSKATDGPAAADAAAAMNSEARAPAENGQPRRKRMGALPPGGFISHLLSSDNKLIGRKFTDFEVRRL